MGRLPIRLLALDIDGTLLTSDRAVAPRTHAALHEARARGVRLVLVTGRRLPSARRIARELGGDVPLVLHNGALVVDGGEILRCLALPRSVAAEAIEVGLAASAEPVLHCGARGEGRLLVRVGARPSPLVSYYLERAGPDVRAVLDLHLALEAEEPMQVMFGGRGEEMEPLRETLGARLADRAVLEWSVYPRSGLVILEILAAGVGKAAAVEFLQDRWGIAAGETMAVGDNWNDREMIARAGLGFVMGNADPGLRRLGLPVLPTNDEDGVAEAIEVHVLGTKKRG